MDCVQILRPGTSVGMTVGGSTLAKGAVASLLAHSLLLSAPGGLSGAVL